MVGQAHRILIVDDDIASLEVLSEVLNRANYRTFSASTGYDAVKIIQEKPLDLAILDYDLPDTTGLELLQHIKRTRPGTFVIIMSANTSTNVKFDVFEAGRVHFYSETDRFTPIPAIREACNRFQRAIRCKFSATR